jgi:hypothetical protein
MSEQQFDPSGNTEQFRAFARRAEPEPDPATGGPNIGMIVGIGVGALIIVALAFVVLGS